VIPDFGLTGYSPRTQRGYIRLMPANVLVIVVDGLRASALGAYGNTMFATPALDQLAAESMLLDWCYATSPDLQDIYRAFWQPTDLATAESDRSSFALPRFLAEHGYSSTLITDEPLLQARASDAGFDEILQLASTQESTNEIREIEDATETELAQLFAGAIESLQIASRDTPHFIWVHSRGMYGTWDAPIAYQQSLLDEDDPPPVESATSPDVLVTPRSDPDAIFRYGCAYAAQVMVLDACVESILGSLPSDEQWLVTLIGARGFSLGEHGRIGGVDSRSYAEMLHVPWLVRLPDHKYALARNSLLTSHFDFAPTLIDALRISAALNDSEPVGASVIPAAAATPRKWRDALVSTSADACAIRTASWSLRLDRGSAAEPELYVRPDDRWEANNVAKLCSDVVEELSKRLTNGGLAR
jgi:arylsulfatase A-like enzyme